MGIFSSKQKQAVNTGPWAPQQPYITKGFGEAENWYNSGGPQFFGGQQTVDRSPLINQSEDALMGYAGGDKLQGLLDQGHVATGEMLGGGTQGYGALFGDPFVGDAYQQSISGDPSPYIGEAARAVRDDMAEDYWGTGGTAPQIRSSQIGSGQYGGSTRGDLMNRRGLDELDENQRQATAGMYANAYENAQNRMLQGLGQAESARAGMGAEGINRYAQGMGQMPGLYGLQSDALRVPGQVGSERMAYDQQLIEDEKRKWNYEQNLPLSNLQNYMGLITGNYGTSGNTVNESRDSAYNIGKGLFNDATGVAAMGFGMSDRRLKTNIKQVGSLPNGLNVYTYHYIWGGDEQLGVMADEVKKVMPHAVINIGGYDAVNYGAIL